MKDESIALEHVLGVDQFRQRLEQVSCRFIDAVGTKMMSGAVDHYFPDLTFKCSRSLHDGTGDEAAVVESVKAASEIYSPVSGTVTAVNEALSGEPGLINSAPETDGWIFKLALDDASELDGLMDAAAYDELTK